MVYTRNTTRPSTAPTGRKRPTTEKYIEEPESSDEDDEGIPSRRAISTPRRSGVVSLRPPKRPHDDECSPAGKSKRRRTDSQFPGLRGGLRLASNSSQPMPRAADGKADSKDSNKSSSPDAENDVSDELAKCISSMLNPQTVHVQQRTPEESPSDQLLQEELLQSTHPSDLKHEKQAGPEEYLEMPPGPEQSSFEADNSSMQDNSSAFDDEAIAVSEDPNMGSDNGVIPDSSPVPQKPPSVQQDPYDIPVSPPPTYPLDESNGFSARVPKPSVVPPTECGFQQIPSSPLPHDLRSFPDNVSPQIHKPRASGSAQVRDIVSSAERASRVQADSGAEFGEEPKGIPKIALSAEDPGSYDETTDRAGAGDKDRKDDECVEIGDSQDDSYDRRDNIRSPTIHGIDGDIGNESDIDLSVEETFSRDIEIFRNRHVPEGKVPSEVFNGPPEDDLIAVHIQPIAFNEALDLMEFKPWSGSRSGRHIHALDAAMAETQPGKYIMPLLAKLKRLYLATPSAPLLRDQNVFLANHSDMITYYFSKIDILIDYIRRQRLERLDHNQSAMNQNKEKRTKMAGEIVSLIIPMIFQVLASAWRLGGDEKNDTQFTTSTVEFLRRGIGWVTRLYYRAVKELSKEGEPQAWIMKSHWTVERWKRDALGPLLTKLVDEIDKAPDMLLAKEDEEIKKQQMLKVQKEREMQWEQDKQEQKLRVKEQNRRAFLSIEGKSVRSTASPSPSRRTASACHQLASPALQWSREEKEFLFRQLRQSYPNLPDLAGYVRRELNRDLDDIRGMSKALLRVMLKEAYDQVGVKTSAADREAEIEDIFKTSGHS